MDCEARILHDRICNDAAAFLRFRDAEQDLLLCETVGDLICCSKHLLHSFL